MKDAKGGIVLGPPKGGGMNLKFPPTLEASEELDVPAAVVVGSTSAIWGPGPRLMLIAENNSLGLFGD